VKNSFIKRRERKQESSKIQNDNSKETSRINEKQQCTHLKSQANPKKDKKNVLPVPTYRN
jgi:hypothetical protein